ncbi:6-phosphogluconolactonase [Apiospora arundinis]|uniref:6-phosphogluconolactonase n=1 Tax=Apiospora arundinis TaxID=335852 RepID=A0ABR2I3U3_9PEZI
MVRFISMMLNLGLALAAPSLMNRQDQAINKKLVVGAAGQILSFQFDGKSFKTISNVTDTGKAASWMIFKQPNHLYAVDENSNTLRLFNYDPATGKISDKPVSEQTGSPGVVSLEFSLDKTRLLGGSYSNGTVDIWDTTAADGTMKFIKNVTLTGDLLNPKHTTHRAHQVVPDPSGRYFAVNDLGGDAIHILDSKKDYAVTSITKVGPVGCGPRHGGFLSTSATPGALPSHYVVLCETMNLVKLYQVAKQADDTLKLTYVTGVSSYGPDSPPLNATTAAAGELTVAANQRDIYVTNRLSGSEFDNVSLFTFEHTDTKANIVFKSEVSSGGVSPRMMSLSVDKDQSIMFVANPMGANGLVALPRNQKCGTLGPQPMAAVVNTTISTQVGGFGPQFVLEIPQK